MPTAATALFPFRSYQHELVVSRLFGLACQAAARKRGFTVASMHVRVERSLKHSADMIRSGTEVTMLERFVDLSVPTFSLAESVSRWVLHELFAVPRSQLYPFLAKYVQALLPIEDAASVF